MSKDRSPEWHAAMADACAVASLVLAEDHDAALELAGSELPLAVAIVTLATAGALIQQAGLEVDWLELRDTFARAALTHRAEAEAEAR
jgi:hypothetical protein